MREINKHLASDEKKYGNHIWAQIQGQKEHDAVQS